MLRDAIGADRMNLSRLEKSKENALHAWRHLAELVEEERAAIGERRQTLLVTIGAREASAYVTEQFGFEEIVGQPCTVDGDEWVSRSRAARVDHPRDDFLADACLAVDQHLGIGSSRRLHVSPQSGKRRPAAEEKQLVEDWSDGTYGAEMRHNEATGGAGSFYLLFDRSLRARITKTDALAGANNGVHPRERMSAWNFPKSASHKTIGCHTHGLMPVCSETRTWMVADSLQLSRHLSPLMKLPMLDRRAHQRYDVLGALWGVLELPEPATVVNVSTEGMLIDAPICPVPNSVHAIRVLVDGEPITVDAIVRHCRPLEDGRHLIGLAFLSAPASVISSIEQLGAGRSVQVIDLEASRS
ncbi:MAG: PilZ domain-containing protein [Vicinamibacterales bacterium]